MTPGEGWREKSKLKNIPNGRFSVTKHRLTEYCDEGKVMVSEWRATWIPETTHGTLKSDGPGYFRAVSKISKDHALRRCRNLVAEFFLSPSEQKAKKQKQVRSTQAIQETIVKPPRGQIRVVHVVPSNGQGGYCYFRWYPIGDQAKWELIEATGDALARYIEMKIIVRWRSRRAFSALDSLRVKVVKTFSGPIEKLTWGNLLPIISLDNDPWGKPASEWEDTLLAESYNLGLPPDFLTDWLIKALECDVEPRTAYKFGKYAKGRTVF